MAKIGDKRLRYCLCRHNHICRLGSSDSPPVITGKEGLGMLVLCSYWWPGTSCDHQGPHSCSKTGRKCSWLEDAGYRLDGEPLCTEDR